MAHRFGARRNKPKTTAAGYGYSHQQARAAAAAHHHPSDPCARCRQPLGPMGPWLHYDHTADRTGYLGFSHSRCNTSAGARVGNQRQGVARRLPLRARRDWYAG